METVRVRKRRRKRFVQAVAFVFGVVTVIVALIVPKVASAFCGFYVSGSQEELYNNATRVAMMRGGQRTVLTMQNNYEGPPEDFAMVVPVPQVLQKQAVKTVEDSVFSRLKSLTAPRLVEYWQKDPCWEPKPIHGKLAPEAAARSGAALGTGSAKQKDEPRVTVESKFSAGEYDIVVLSSNESTALDSWLRDNNYNIPKGAAKYFRPYIQQGMYFFVAKVDVSKVTFEGDRAMLSPLRFHYESKDFKLPVRLGLINSKGKQDLIAYLLAENQRYRAANYPNVTIPTNLPVKEQVKKGFAQFYDSLFTRLLEENPRAVVTEYSWTATSCDPCPVQPLNAGHLSTLGADIIRNNGATPGESSCDTHNPESNGWVAFDSDALNQIEGMAAGRVDGNSGESSSAVTFGGSFRGKPLVFAQSQTTNNNDGAMAVHAQSVNGSGAELAFCHQNGPNNCDNRSSERLGWFAVDPSQADKRPGLDWGTVESSGEWQDVSFDSQFDSVPVVIATVQGDGEISPGLYAEVRRTGTSSAQVRVCKSRGGNNCSSHTTETVAWFAIERGEIRQNGRVIGEAGYVSHLDDAEWDDASFEVSFDTTPLVFATTQTTRGAQDPSAAHVQYVDVSGFQSQHCEFDFEERPRRNRLRARRLSRGWTVTRLHARYSDDTLGEDIVFEPAPPIRGGRGMPQGKEGQMVQQTPDRAHRNNFQARYVVRHRWDGDVECSDPNWNRWGGRGSQPVSASDTSPGGSSGGSDGEPSIRLGKAIEQTDVPGLQRDLDSEASGSNSTETTGEDASPEGKEADESSGADETSSNGGESDSDSSADPGDLDEMIEEENTGSDTEDLYEGGDASRKGPSRRPWRGLGVLALALVALSSTWWLKRWR